MIMLLMMQQQHERPQRSRSKQQEPVQQHSLHQLSVQVIQPSMSYASAGSATTISTAGRSSSSHMLHQPQQLCSNSRPVTLQDPQQQKNLKQCITTCNAPLYRRLFNYIREAWTGVRSALDAEIEELGEATPRYRPDSLQSLRRATRFTDGEIKAIYRGFKAECPTGIFREETFKLIYSQFFPQGANTNNYAHYLFNTLNPDNSGCVSFEEFVHVLSILSRGSLDEKLHWAFSLYDINGDGYITKDEMTDIVTAIYDLMGDFAQQDKANESVKHRVECIFKKMDVNKDGRVTLEEFLECCKSDEGISRSLTVFDTAI